MRIMEDSEIESLIKSICTVDDIQAYLYELIEQREQARAEAAEE